MKHILLQGLPGVGKTTLVKKIANKLNEMAIESTGFYTEELRDNHNQRMGFDIVTLDNQRGILARKSGSDAETKYRVGAYNVYLKEFEKVALPVFENLKSVVIIDEIGKMELFSKKFQAAIENAFANKNIKIIATVPLKGGPSLVQKLKQNSSCNLITVNAANRNQLLDEIIQMLV